MFLKNKSFYKWMRIWLKNFLSNNFWNLANPHQWFENPSCPIFSDLLLWASRCSSKLLQKNQFLDSCGWRKSESFEGETCYNGVVNFVNHLLIECLIVKTMNTWLLQSGQSLLKQPTALLMTRHHHSVMPGLSIKLEPQSSGELKCCFK